MIFSQNLKDLQLQHDEVVFKELENKYIVIIDVSSDEDTVPPPIPPVQEDAASNGKNH